MGSRLFGRFHYAPHLTDAPDCPADRRVLQNPVTAPVPSRSSLKISLPKLWQ